MRMLTLATVLIVIGISSVSSARCETLFYKSTPLYSSVTKFIKDNPEFSCEKESGAVTCTSSNSTYGGYKAKEIKAEFYGNKLSFIGITITTPWLGIFNTVSKDIIDGLTIKYGKPTPYHDEDLERIANVIGSKLNSIRWERNGDFMELIASEGKNIVPAPTNIESSPTTPHYLYINIICKNYDATFKNFSKKHQQGDL